MCDVQSDRVSKRPVPSDLLTSDDALAVLTAWHALSARQRERMLIIMRDTARLQAAADQAEG